MKKVVSYSLWGKQSKYLIGAVRNAELCPKIYPGWVARFYVGTSVPVEFRHRLSSLGAEVIQVNEPGDWRGMFWRFEAAIDPEVEIMLSRDCDSRLSNREASAVEEWLSSPALFHIMRDHPYHDRSILGGMWGVKAPLLRNITELIQQYPMGDFYQVDQDFLHEIVYPMVKDVSLVHDEFYEKCKYPTKRRGLEFVGQVFDENDAPSIPFQKILSDSLNQSFLNRAYRWIRLRIEKTGLLNLSC